MVVASKQGGNLNVAVNGKMFQTTISNLINGSPVSSYVQNQIQQVQISSTINHEKYVIFFYYFRFFCIK